MKKFTFLMALLGGFVLNAEAQKIETVPQTSASVGLEPIKQGNWMLGGSIGNIGYSFEGDQFRINLNPRAGYFITDGLAIGAQANLGLATFKGEDNVYNYGISPFVRYYFPRGASSTGRFFGQGDIGIAGSSPGSDVSLALGANVGYAHFITQTVALEVMGGYNYSKANLNSGNGQSGLGISLGFQIYLPGQR